MSYVSKKLLSLTLSAAMCFSLAAPALAAEGDADAQASVTQEALEERLGGNYLYDGAESESEDGLTVQAVISALLSWSGMEERQLGEYPRDYIAMADSMGMVDKDDESFDSTALCTEAELEDMMEEAQVLYDALHPEDGTMEPLFMNGMAQPIFPYTSGAVEEGYSNEESDIIRFFVYVETNYDTDGDGKLDLVKTLVQLPRAAAEGDYQAATIYEARPYITGCTSGRAPYGDEGYDLASMYSQPDPRVPEGTATTMDVAANADSSEWYYYNPYERMWDYEDLTWYDYYLVRGFAVVECGGLGTLGSDGFETCGTDLEIDAFKCVIEWLHGDRVAYTDKTSNIAIKADWSNGKVGMTGRSYAGTTQFGLATTGVEGLETIVPVAGIASWYEYTNSQGISTSSNPAYSDYLAFYCSGRYLDQEDWSVISEDYGNYLYQIQQDQLALNGDYGKHWATRDYTLNWDNIQCPALIVHGLNDDNVRTKEFQLMYDAYQKAGVDAKLLLHQGHHMTPTYPSGEMEMYIGDEMYDEILNQWFSHYLYDLDNGIEDMAAVTIQSNLDADEWTTYDSWDTAYELVLDAEAAEDTTTITSDYASAGVNRGNWQDSFASGSTAGNAMYAVEVPEDTNIQGSVAVHFRAATSNVESEATPNGSAAAAYSSIESAYEGPDIMDHDNLVDPSRFQLTPASLDLYPAVNSVVVPDDGENAGESSTLGRDALMVSAMLVDIAPEGETFPAFHNNNVEETILEEGGAWMGGGVDNFDLMVFSPEQVEYKIIARGWMDLCNPDAGYDSASATREKRVDLVEGQYYDYTLYLQPNAYEVQAGHKLALVIYAYEPGKASYTQNYAITLDNSSITADVPVHDSSSDGTLTAQYVSEELSDMVNFTASAENGGTVTASVSNGLVASGTEVTITAEADDHYRFDGWTVNGEAYESTESTITLTIDQNTTVSASFTYVSSGSGGGSGSSSSSSWSITVEEPENGSVSVSDTRARSGERVTVTVTANDGYVVDEVTVTGRSGDEITVTDRGNGTYTFNMPSERVTVAASFVAIPDSETGEDDGTLPFADVASGDWYYAAVQYAYDNGLMAGTSTAAFSPDLAVTRGMMVTILYSLEGTPEAASAGFTDVADGQWYAAAVNWAASNGIVSGYGDGVFGPNDTITREQMAAILYRYAQYKGCDVTASADLSGYADVDQISSYALTAMQWANAEGLISGTSATALSPDGPATRAQAAAIFMQFCENVAQ